jgi:hypothetical protein
MDQADSSTTPPLAALMVTDVSAIMAHVAHETLRCQVGTIGPFHPAVWMIVLELSNS